MIDENLETNLHTMTELRGISSDLKKTVESEILRQIKYDKYEYSAMAAAGWDSIQKVLRVIQRDSNTFDLEDTLHQLVVAK